MSHHTFEQVVELPEAASEIALAQLLSRAQKELGTGEVTLEFSRDVVHKLACRPCGRDEEVFAAVGTVPYRRGQCPACKQMRSVITAHGYSGAESFGERTLDRLGLPLFDVFTARSAERELAFLIAGDEPAVLSELAVASAQTRASGASQ
jgi:phage FluMu protein Com